MNDLALGLTYGWPTSEWKLDGDQIEGLTWLSDDPQPTIEQIEKAAADAAQAATDKQAADAAAREAAIAHAKSLGFTDEMIAVMYPGLTV
jgi:hypothetical protein